MRRALLVLLTSIALVVPIVARTNTPSLEALRDAQGNIHCTVFSINEKEHLWMTALHCVVPIDDAGMPSGNPYPSFINDEPVQIYKEFPLSGTAIVYTPRQSAKNYKLARREVYYGEPIEVTGHGLGLEKLTWFRGEVAVMNIEGGNGLFYNIYSMPVCHGHSGSPVVDADSGRVMGVMQILLGPGACGSPSGGTTLPDLTRETGSYWQD